jgi:hypothetical protein
MPTSISEWREAGHPFATLDSFVSRSAIEGVLWIAAKPCTGVGRIGAQRSEVGLRVRDRHHRVRARLVFAIKRSRFGNVESASSGIFGIVEPEADMKSVRRRKAYNRIEAENLVEQDRLDRYIGIAIAIGLEIALIPRQAEVLEVGVGLAICQQVAVLGREQIKSQVRLQVPSMQDEHVVELSPNYRHCGCRFVGRRAAEAGGKRGVDGKFEGGF